VLSLLFSQSLQFSTANRNDGAHLDVVTREFWGQNKQHMFYPSLFKFMKLVTPGQWGARIGVCKRVDIMHMMSMSERLRELAFHH